MTVAVSPTTELPAVGTPMFLVVDEGVNFLSRLESVEGDTFTVTAPLETAAVTVLDREFYLLTPADLGGLELDPRLVC